MHKSVCPPQPCPPGAAAAPAMPCTHSRCVGACMYLGQASCLTQPTQRRPGTGTWPSNPHNETPACAVACLPFLQRLSSSDLSGLEAAEVSVHTPRAGPAVPKPPEAATPDLTVAAGAGCLPRWMQQGLRCRSAPCTGLVHAREYTSPAGCCSSQFCTAEVLLLLVMR